MTTAADDPQALYCRVTYDEAAGAIVLHPRWMMDEEANEEADEEAERVYRGGSPTAPPYAPVAAYTPAALIGSLSTLGAHALFALIAAPPGERDEVHRALIAEYANLVATVVEQAGNTAAQLPGVQPDSA
jgi:hypothetical protein